MRTKAYLSAVSGIVVLLLLLVVFTDNEANELHDLVFVVTAQETSALITERGVLVSNDVDSIRAGASGVIVELAEDGTRVSKGQHVLTMDSSEPETWYNDTQDRIATLQNDKVRAERELSVVQLEERNRELINLENLKLAKLNLEIEMAGASSSSRRLLDIDIALARIDLTESREELDREQRLYEKGLSSQLDIEKARRVLVSREAQLEELLIAKKLQEEGSPQEIIEELKSKVDMQEFLVSKSKSVSEGRIKRIRNNIQTIEERIAVARQDLTISGSQIKGAVAYANRDGLLINKGFKDWRNAGRWVPNTVGTMRYIGDVIYDVINPSDVNIELLINEVDYDLVEEGQNVDIVIPALQYRRFKGVLSSLGGMGRDRSDASITSDDIGKADVTVYNATVSFDDTSADLRPGMSAIITFPATRTQSLLIIPREYARETDAGRYMVKKLVNNNVVEVEISGSRSDVYFIKVNDGLTAGDQLLRWGSND